MRSAVLLPAVDLSVCPPGGCGRLDAKQAIEVIPDFGAESRRERQSKPVDKKASRSVISHRPDSKGYRWQEKKSQTIHHTGYRSATKVGATQRLRNINTRTSHGF